MNPCGAFVNARMGVPAPTHNHLRGALTFAQVRACLLFCFVARLTLVPGPLVASSKVCHELDSNHHPAHRRCHWR